MKELYQCLFSPRLYRIYGYGPRDTYYQPHALEKWGDKVIKSANTIIKIGLYTSPFICMYIYKRGYTFEQIKSLTGLITGIGCLIALSYVIRGYGRTRNHKYMEFLNDLTKSVSKPNNNLVALRQYDFEFHAWPVTFKMPPAPSTPWFKNHPFSVCANEDLPLYQRLVIQQLAFVATHTFGLRLIYPGCLGIVHHLLWEHLFNGRTQLVEGFGGQRTKIGTADGNNIDTMYVDNRPNSPKGKTLVICCEGNSGFYEIGIMTTPIKAGYSALGWNHPGFAGSTGIPYPSQEKNAIDAVMQFAINKLGFEPDEIVLLGWSIGGYTATWAASNYPVKALVLDATFDDLLPLALNQMPSSWSLLVKEVIRSYVNLDIATMMKKYDGPVTLVRRTQDEIICLRQGDMATNRGNDLLISIINHRHTDAVEEEEHIDMLLGFVSLNESQRTAISTTDMPKKGKELLNLVSKYTRDYRSTHCTPLPEDLFKSIMDSIEVKTPIKS